MNKQVWQVAKWEFMYFFKWKQELIGKLVMLGIALVVFFWQSASQFTHTQYQVAVKGATNFQLTHDDYVFIKSTESDESQKSKLQQGELDAFLVIDETTQPIGITFYSEGKLAWQQNLQSMLKGYYLDQLSEQLAIAPDQLKLLNNPIAVSAHYLNANVKTEDRKSTLTATGVLVLLSAGIFMSFAQIFVSITGEKQQRVTEQLYATMAAQSWIDGKVLGQVLLAIKVMTSTLISVILGLAFIQVIIKGQSLDLSMIDWSLLPWVTAFAISGLYMVTAFMAAIAAAIDDPNHSGKSSFMMIPLVPMIIAFLLMDSPSGWVMQFLSYFPFTAFAVMPVKMALIDVPFWQPLLALSITLVTCVFMRIVAGRLFKMGMTMYGKEPSFKQMLGWAIKGD